MSHRYGPVDDCIRCLDCEALPGGGSCPAETQTPDGHQAAGPNPTRRTSA